MFSHLGLCALVLGYSVMGTLVFMAVESTSEHELELDRNITRAREETVNKMWEITQKFNVFHHDNWTHQMENEIKVFQKKLIEAVKGSYTCRGNGNGTRPASCPGRSPGSHNQWDLRTNLTASKSYTKEDGDRNQKDGQNKSTQNGFDQPHDQCYLEIGIWDNIEPCAPSIHAD